jgi:hypothetical protein
MSAPLNVPVRETEKAIASRWSEKDGLSFKNELLVAHGATKKSYHIIVKVFDLKGVEVLMRDFSSCKTVAEIVNSALGDKILVDRMSAHGDESVVGSTSFIDLSIYTKDRPFRLLGSSKITSPGRSFVLSDASCSEQEDEDLEKWMKETLVVPDAEQSNSPHKTIEITDNHAASVPIVNNKEHADTKGSSCFRSEVSADTCLPLLDHGRGKVYSQTLGRKIDQPFDRLLPWVQDLASQLPGAKMSGPVVIDARYERSLHEAYIHFTIHRSYASHCHFIGRSHLQNNIMISIDLLSKAAYQRCWDFQCKDPMRNKRKARHLLASAAPDGIVPSMQAISKFEQKKYAET